MEKKQYITLHTDQFNNELKKVALTTARNLANLGLDETNLDKYYTASGLQLLFRILINDGIIRDHVDAIFIENSNLFSTLEEKTLDAHTLVWQGTEEENKDEAGNSFRKNVEKHFRGIVKKLRENHEAIFNHPKFLIEPTEIQTYISYMGSDFFKKSDSKSRISEGEEKAEKLYVKYKEELFDDNDNRKNLHKVYDELKKRYVYVNSNSIKAADIDYNTIVSKELLDKYLAVTEDPYPLHILNHLLYQKYFINKTGNSNHRKSIFISLPLLGSNDEYIEGETDLKNLKYRGLGSLFIFLLLRDENSKDPNHQLSAEVFNDTFDVLLERIENYCRNIPALVKDFSHGYAIQINHRLIEKIEKEAVKSAIAAVMSRNMSHNIGSHVIPESITHFQNEILKVIKTSVIAENARFVQNHENKEEGIEKVKISESALMNYEDSIQKYNFYLQERMELIAEVSSSTGLSVCFEYNLKELIDEFDNNIIIKHGLIDSLNTDESIVELTQINTDITVSLPGGQIGVQAFYLILENKIRNCFKHARPGIDAGQNIYPITICVSEYPIKDVYDNYFAIDVYDTLGEYNNDRDSEIINNINLKIDSKILQDDKTLRQEGWGLLEMKISAAYLINFPLKELDTDFRNSRINIDGVLYPKIIKADSYSNEGVIENNIQDKNIGYRFSLLKPKFCLISSKFSPNLTNSDLLKRHGIEFSNNMENMLNSPYQFIITDSDFKIKTNQRVLLSSNIIIDFSNITEEKINLFKDSVWQKWIDTNFSEIKNIKIVNKTDELAEQTDFSSIAVFDSHGRDVKVNSTTFEFATFLDLKNLFYYYEPFTTRSGTLSLLNQKQSFKNELIESIGISVCIIDERIQEAANKYDSNQKKMKISELLALSGITMPPKDETYDLKKLMPNTARCKDLIENYILEAFKTSKYVIIHFTIFEKLVGSTNPIKIKEYLDAFNNKNELEENGKILILMSGRGTPSNLPKGCYYIHLSTIQNAILLKRSKFSLIKILNSIRKSK